MVEQAEMRVPSATYRLQMNRGFTFRDAQGLLDYLDALGISHLYLSPIFKARPGSLHGYDVVDHSSINPELGGEDQFESLSSAARSRGIGVVLDVVPNHMCIASAENHWWNDVLESGPSSPFASYFDIDWNPPKPDLANKVLLPVLGESFGNVVEKQEIGIEMGPHGFEAVYHDNRFPLAPETWTVILEPALGRLVAERGDSAPPVRDLRSLIEWVSRLPPRTLTTPEGRRNRYREKTLLKEHFGDLMERHPALREAAQESIEELRGRPGDSRSFEPLASLLDQQAYRLSHWPVSGDEINYRRFFDINELAALAVEEAGVFESTHELVFRLIEKGLVVGLRIDHVDGLLDPAGYLNKLPRGSYVIVEKILEADENLPQDWPVAGTTGYEFANALNGIFVDPHSASAFRRLYARFTGRRRKFPDILYQSKMAVLRTSMWGDLSNMSRRLDRISEQHHLSRDFTRRRLERALARILASFPVYRTYIGPADGSVSSVDRQHIVHGVEAARKRSSPSSRSVYDFIASVFLLDEPEGLPPSARRERRKFVLKVQQMTAPVTAKGVEDTAFYRYYPLCSLAEVGGSPDRFGVRAEEFHRRNQYRLRHWPKGLSASSTHDTKREEDVRARINVLSEIPLQWEERLFEWRTLNRRHKILVNDAEVPDANEEYLLYQTLVGSWPQDETDDRSFEDFVTRIQSYMTKALREAKLHTSWRATHRSYEDALSKFVAAVLDRSGDNPFLEDLTRFQASILRPGLLNSLSQTLLKIASPGVPDFYQGTELWSFHLVDPDNRGPVDFQRRRQVLADVARAKNPDAAALCDRLFADLPDGRLKLYVANRGLEYRRAHRALFLDGDYVPLDARGKNKDHIVAFARRMGKEETVVVAARFFTRLPAPPIRSCWDETHLTCNQPAAKEGPILYRDILTDRQTETMHERAGGDIPLSQALYHLPVALLEKVS